MQAEINNTTRIVMQVGEMTQADEGCSLLELTEQQAAYFTPLSYTDNPGHRYIAEDGTVTVEMPKVTCPLTQANLDRAAARQSALEKLQKLGLTEAEALALSG